MRRLTTKPRREAEARRPHGQYLYRAGLDGNAIELYRDGVHAGSAAWNGGKIEGFPEMLSQDARDDLTAAIEKNLVKAWSARPETFGQEMGIGPDPVFPNGAPKTQDAGHHGQMGNEVGRPSRQGEAEVGTGGPGYDPDTGELGGQAMGRPAPADQSARPPSRAGAARAPGRRASR